MPSCGERCKRLCGCCTFSRAQYLAFDLVNNVVQDVGPSRNLPAVPCARFSRGHYSWLTPQGLLK
jgi:hypothetical protein